MSSSKETKENKQIDQKKMKSIALLAIVCVLSLGLTSSFEDKNSEVTNIDEVAIQKEEVENNDLETKLKNILSQINGAGEVDVMITLDSSEEIKPAYNIDSTNEKSSEKDKNGGERTVTTSSENKTLITSSSNEPIVITTKEPIIKGVIVVSSGAEDPVVKETLYKAVQTALQVEGHQVEIFDK